MSNPHQRPAVEYQVEDPTTGIRHTFSGATQEEADAAFREFFGVDEADEEDAK